MSLRCPSRPFHSHWRFFSGAGWADLCRRLAVPHRVRYGYRTGVVEGISQVAQPMRNGCPKGAAQGLLQMSFWTNLGQ
jgi:hypothetical protein